MRTAAIPLLCLSHEKVSIHLPLLSGGRVHAMREEITGNIYACCKKEGK